MANEPRPTALPSILDRLLDDEPDESRDKSKSPAQVLRELRDSVLRDVSNLLNTRRALREVPPGLEELRPSSLDYGIADFTGADLVSAQDRDAFRRSIEDAIRRYEPRFKTVRVHLLSNAEPLDRTLRFRVEAVMHADPAPEAIVFDSSVDPVKCGFKVASPK